MRFEKTDRVSHPASAVLDIMIERMEEIVPFLPSVESIETQERKSLKDGRVRIVRRWQGSTDNLPTALRPFLTKELLAWIDTALWTPKQYKVDWSLATSVGADLYDCTGTNYFEPHPDDPQDATQIRVTGDLTVHPDRVPGLPRFLAGRLAPQIEKFIVGMMTPNLMEVAAGLQGYLDQGARSAKPGKRSRRG